MLPSLLSTPSPATVRVEKATSHLLMGPDWTLNMDICDSINTDPLHAKDFVKAVKKRLQNKNPRVQFLALMLLETMIKNCGDFVHFQVVDREILQDMVKIVRKTSDMQVRDKILVLLESWQEAFGGPGGRYPQYYYAYAELKTSGMSFPQHQKDAALIYTHATPSYHPQVGYGIPSSSVEGVDGARVSETGNLRLSDLNNIRSVLELFLDMLRAVNPGDHQAVNDEVITDLASQCRLNQKKVMQLINSTENEELLGVALELNDNLQNALAKLDAIASESAILPETVHGLSRPTALLQSISAVGQQVDGREVEEDGSTYLAHSDSKFKETGNQQVSPNRSDITTAASTSGASEATSPVASNALVLLDPPTPVSNSKKDEDMIDLLSLVLLTDSSSQTPAAPLPPSDQNQNPFSASPSWQQYPNNPQHLMSNNGHITFNSYVAPWAQSTVSQSPGPLPPILPQQQVTQYPHNDQSQLWTSTPEISSNPFLSTTSFQYPPSQFTTAPALTYTPSGPASHLQHPASQSTMSQTSAAPATSFQYPASMAPASAAPVPVQDSKSIQLYNPIGSKGTQMNANNFKQTADSSTAPKPYVMPDKLFEGLIELRNPDGSLKSRSASTLWGPAGQGVNSTRK